MTWTLVLAPTLALVGALLGSLVAPLLTARRTRALWLLQQQAQTYVEAIQVAQACASAANNRADPEWRYINPLPTARDSPDLWRIDAGMNLHAGAEVLETWAEMVDAYAALRSASDEDDPGHEGLGFDDERVLALQKASTATITSCRSALHPLPRRGIRKAL